MHLFEIYNTEAREIIKTMSNKAIDALASLYLEGVALSIESLKDFKLLDDGKITNDEYRARAAARVQI